jgi:superfamily II RNA helicase
MTSPYVRVVTETEPVPEPPLTPALVTGYEPDRFQKFAIAAIEAGENVLVTAKTGSGKTFVGEYQIAKSLARGGRIFYTTPIKSLSNQKFHDLKNLFPSASVGIMTGDIKFRPDAEILVMTTEILRNLLFKKGTKTEHVGATALVSLDRLDSVIFDEVHYINDPDRGHVWEETLMLLDPSIKLILLSATLSSPYGFAQWLGESKKVKVWLISTLWRAVPLEHCVIGSDGKALVIYDSKEQFHQSVYHDLTMERAGNLLALDKFKDRVKDARRSGHEGPVGGKVRIKAFEHQINELLGGLEERNSLPAIFFVFSRAGCERLADLCQGHFLDSSDAAAVAHIWDFHLSRFRQGLEKSPQYHTLKALAMRGIAFHHSGLLPFMKEILEILFSKGYIKVLFATETFAVGINMPTKTVVFTALEKFTDGRMRSLTSSEYIQMAGRAGRRGKDERGLVIYLPQKDPLDMTSIRGILTGKSAKFGSRMTFHYDFLLKSLNGISMDSLIEKTYWRRLLQDDIEKLEKDLVLAQNKLETQKALLTDQERTDCSYKVVLEEKVAQLQNAKKKAAQRELEAWKVAHRESQWNPILERYNQYINCVKECEHLEDIRKSLEYEATVPSLRHRQAVLEEYGYVDPKGCLTEFGLLASEINEGQPFLMTELFLRLQNKSKSWELSQLLCILAIFLGESKKSDEMPKDPADLDIDPFVRNELIRIQKDAEQGCKRDGGNDPEFWALNTEWVEPISMWVSGEELLASVAAEYGLFEGNMQRALMKLMGLVDEFKALATLTNDIGWLSALEGAQAIVLRDVVVAESLYLRI